MKDKTLTISLIIVALITICIVLYAKTDVFKRIADWLVWFYNGLKDFNWSN